MELEPLLWHPNNFVNSRESRQHYRLANLPLQESTCTVGVKAQTNSFTSHLTDILFLSRNIITFDKINIEIVLLEAYPNICYIKNSHDINISHKSCSDGVNKKLPSEISVKPDLTKDLKENKQTDTHKDTHTQNKPYVNSVWQSSHYFDTILWSMIQFLPRWSRRNESATGFL